MQTCIVSISSDDAGPIQMQPCLDRVSPAKPPSIGVQIYHSFQISILQESVEVAAPLAPRTSHHIGLLSRRGNQRKLKSCNTIVETNVEPHWLTLPEGGVCVW